MLNSILSLSLCCFVICHAVLYVCLSVCSLVLVYAFVGLLHIVSISGNKRVSFEEFLPFFLSGQQKKDSGSMEDFIEGLRVFDKDGNGFINSAELRHVLTSLGKFKLIDPSFCHHHAYGCF